MSEASELLGATTASATPITTNQDGVPTNNAPAAGNPPEGQSSDSAFKFDEETQKYVDSKGWKNPSDLLKSYRNLEKAYSGSKNIVALPDEKDPKSVDEFFKKIGRPEAPDKYGFEPKNDNQKEFLEKFKEGAFKANLTVSQAKAVAEWIDNYDSSNKESALNELKIQTQNEINELKKEWGSAYDNKLAIANQGMKAAGLDSESVDAIQGAIGLKNTIALLNKIGSIVGEDTASGLANGAGKFAMSPGEAKAEISKLQSDKTFVERLYNPRDAGHKEAIDKWTNLHNIAFQN